jgi:hypothetical protein
MSKNVSEYSVGENASKIYIVGVTGLMPSKMYKSAHGT